MEHVSAFEAVLIVLGILALLVGGVMIAVHNQKKAAVVVDDLKAGADGIAAAAEDAAAEAKKLAAK